MTRWDQARAKSQLGLRKPYKPVDPIGSPFAGSDRACGCCGYLQCAKPLRGADIDDFNDDYDEDNWWSVEDKTFVYEGYRLDIGDRLMHIDTPERGVVVKLDYDHGLIRLSTGAYTDKVVSWDVLVNAGWQRERRAVDEFSNYRFEGLPLLVGDRLKCKNGQEAVVTHLGAVVEARPVVLHLTQGGTTKQAMSFGYMTSYWTRLNPKQPVATPSQPTVAWYTLSP